MSVEVSLARRCAAEFLGAAFLLAVIVGSGIMGERLCGGNVAIALLANTLATGAGLLALIMAFAPVSGAHFNPAVTLASALNGGLRWKDAAAYGCSQLAGAISGVFTAHLMFDLAAFAYSHKERSGFSQAFSEFVATYGLLVTIAVGGRYRPNAVPVSVSAYITAGYWFTASTALANPGVTLARSLTDTFSGIRPVDVPAFLAAQFAATVVAVVFCRWFLGCPASAKPDVEATPHTILLREQS